MANQRQLERLYSQATPSGSGVGGLAQALDALVVYLLSRRDEQREREEERGYREEERGYREEVLGLQRAEGERAQGRWEEEQQDILRRREQEDIAAGRQSQLFPLQLRETEAGLASHEASRRASEFQLQQAKALAPSQLREAEARAGAAEFELAVKRTPPALVLGFSPRSDAERMGRLAFEVEHARHREAERAWAGVAQPPGMAGVVLQGQDKEQELATMQADLRALHQMADYIQVPPGTSGTDLRAMLKDFVTVSGLEDPETSQVFNAGMERIVKRVLLANGMPYEAEIQGLTAGRVANEDAYSAYQDKMKVAGAIKALGDPAAGVAVSAGRKVVETFPQVAAQDAFQNLREALRTNASEMAVTGDAKILAALRVLDPPTEGPLPFDHDAFMGAYKTMVGKKSYAASFLAASQGVGPTGQPEADGVAVLAAQQVAQMMEDPIYAGTIRNAAAFRMAQSMGDRIPEFAWETGPDGTISVADHRLAPAFEQAVEGYKAEEFGPLAWRFLMQKAATQVHEGHQRRMAELVAAPPGSGRLLQW